MKQWRVYLYELDVSDVDEMALNLSEEEYEFKYKDKSRIVVRGALYYLIVCSVKSISY